MLSVAKVKFWQSHSGDPGFADKVLRADRDGVTYDEWMLVTELITRIRLSQTGDASEVFRSRTQEMLDSHASDPEVFELLLKLASSTPTSETS